MSELSGASCTWMEAADLLYPQIVVIESVDEAAGFRGIKSSTDLSRGTRTVSSPGLSGS